MKTRSLIIVLAACSTLCHLARATQADDTTITITGQAAGVTPFISQLTLNASDTTVIKSIQFTITPKTGSVTRPLSGTYSQDYLVSRGYLVPPSLDIFLPVYGLYAGSSNTVVLTYQFLDGSSKEDNTTIVTDPFDDQGCGYNNPMVLQARTDNTDLSYDYIFVRGGCTDVSPVILDTDGVLRWVSPLFVPNALIGSSVFFENAVYGAVGSTLSRVDLDGTITPLGDYSADGVLNFHHNIDPGKTGLLLEADTTDFYESILMEVDLSGAVLKTWNLADIISAAMTAGGDDPTQFVHPTPEDWFHNNAATYNRADDSLIISSREDFVIALDYETGAIKWILGDQTKKWFTFPSLAQFALNMTGDNLPPIGQHAVSITFDQDLLLYDDGFFSTFQQPPGENRTYSSPRKHQLSVGTPGPGGAGTSTVVWSYDQNQTIYSPICSSVYEDAPLNYLIDHAVAGGLGAMPPYGQLLGLNAAGEMIFYYEYAATFCNQVYNSLPVHLEKSQFPTVGARALNLSARGLVGPGDDSLIGGFIVTGTDPQVVVLRALGPSLAVPGTVADPVLTIYDSAGTAIGTNDDWESDPGAAQLSAIGLAPTDPAEAATVQTLTPGAYTFVVTGKDSTLGIGLVETYDLSPLAAARLANLSTRGSIGTGDGVLIGGFIVGQTESNTVVIRAIGPSLASFGIADPLSDPMLTVFDSNGVALGSNDNWEDDKSAADIMQNGLAPTDAAESATVLHLPAGAYTAIVSGVNGGTGIGLVEVYDL